MGLYVKVSDESGNSIEIDDSVARPQPGDIATLRIRLNGHDDAVVLNRADMLELHRTIGEILNAQPIVAVDEERTAR